MMAMSIFPNCPCRIYWGTWLKCRSAKLTLPRLIRLRSDLPERFSDLGAVLARREPDWAKITDICRRMELKSILKELPVVPENAPEPDQDDLFSAVSAAPAPETAPSPAMEQGELF